jgi:16S rRNA processing protein RimM
LNPPGLVRIGRISGPHGLVGGLRLRPDNPGSESLGKLGRIFAELGGSLRELRITSVARINQTVFKLTLDSISSIDAAEALRGAVVFARQEDLPTLSPDEFYYHAVAGCEVVTSDGEKIGVVAETFSNGANDVWVVRNGSREVLVPVIEDVVKGIDLEARVLTIEPVPGLFD